MDLYMREDEEEQFPSGRKRRAEREFVVEMDQMNRLLRRPKLETDSEVIHRMRLVEMAVKEDLAAKGETHFTDQEFPPTNQSLCIDPDNPSPKLQASSVNFRFISFLSARGDLIVWNVVGLDCIIKNLNRFNCENFPGGQ
jgi:hypothetical protein